LVLEKSYDEHNHYAVVRTAECLGIQYLWIIEPVEMKKKKKFNRAITKGKEDWLSIREFTSTKSCIEALQADGREIWATDLSQTAIDLEKSGLTLPKKLAIVIGRESEGVSNEMLSVAQKHIYLPIHGFSESLNLSVASALIIQRLFIICPEMRGDLSDIEKHELREKWYNKLAQTPEQQALYPLYVNHPPTPLNDLRLLEQHRIAWVEPKIKKRIASIQKEKGKGEPQSNESTTTTKGDSISLPTITDNKG